MVFYSDFQPEGNGVDMSEMAASYEVAVGPSPQVYGAWHKTELPSGNKDKVRVAHTDSATYCDFKARDRLDTQLISLNAPWQACVPTKDV